MKRLVGGDYQLDLSPIEIEESVDGETYTSITDKSVLDQLTGLKVFIGKSGMIKPVWVKLLNGETDEIIVTRGSLSTSDGTTFLIKVLLVGFILTLSVEFTQAETEDHAPLDEWYIDANDAKYILISDAQSLAGELADFEGDVSITGDLSVTGKINDEANPSVKPIYCHPVYCTLFRGEDNLLVTFTCLIFNNSPTPFTTETFIQYCKTLFSDYPTASIMISGYASKDPLSRIQDAPLANQIQLQSPNAAGDANDFWTISLSDMESTGASFIDGVNKIN